MALRVPSWLKFGRKKNTMMSATQPNEASPIPTSSPSEAGAALQAPSTSSDATMPAKSKKPRTTTSSAAKKPAAAKKTSKK